MGWRFYYYEIWGR